MAQCTGYFFASSKYWYSHAVVYIIYMLNKNTLGVKIVRGQEEAAL